MWCPALKSYLTYSKNVLYHTSYLPCLNLNFKTPYNSILSLLRKNHITIMKFIWLSLFSSHGRLFNTSLFVRGLILGWSLVTSFFLAIISWKHKIKKLRKFLFTEMLRTSVFFCVSLLFLVLRFLLAHRNL